jgi:SAM-dependent methyltransferase
MREMAEPYRSRFIELIRDGGATRDVHLAAGDDETAALPGEVDDRYVARELERVALHQRSLTPLLETTVGRAARVLDFGCGTGGTTVALALSALAPSRVVGVDANPWSVAAAEVRARGHGLADAGFVHTAAGDELPFADGSFDLVTAVSVLEFIPDAAARDATVERLRRLVAPGGHLYIATPWPRVREHHSRRWLADLRREPGWAWSSPPWQVERWGRGWEPRSLSSQLAEVVRRRAPAIPPRLLAALAPILPTLSAWQKRLWRRPR